MCLVIFGWLANQTYFKELTDVDDNVFDEFNSKIENDKKMNSDNQNSFLKYLQCFKLIP